jgi:hypothetical protein
MRVLYGGCFVAPPDTAQAGHSGCDDGERVRAGNQSRSRGVLPMALPPFLPKMRNEAGARMRQRIGGKSLVDKATSSKV